MQGLLANGLFAAMLTEVNCFCLFCDPTSGATAAQIFQPAVLLLEMKSAGLETARMGIASQAPALAFARTGELRLQQVFVATATASTP